MTMCCPLFYHINMPNKHIKLYHHKTDGGAEYLTDTFIKWKHNGKTGKEGTFNDKTKFIVRIDGDIREDAEITIKPNTEIKYLEDEIKEKKKEMLANHKKFLKVCGFNPKEDDPYDFYSDLQFNEEEDLAWYCGYIRALENYKDDLIIDSNQP